MGSEHPLVKGAGIRAKSVEVIGLAVGELFGKFTKGRGGVDVVVGCFLNRFVIAQIIEWGEQVRFRMGENLGVRTEHALEQGRPAAGRAKDEDEILVKHGPLKPQFTGFFKDFKWVGSENVRKITFFWDKSNLGIEPLPRVGY